MAYTDLSTVQHKLVGISFLGEQNQLLQQHWVSRLSPLNAFFVDAEPDEDERKVAQRVVAAISAQSITSLAGTVIFAFFLDLRKPIEQAQVEKMARTYSMLEKNFHCMSRVMWFGYTGIMAFEDVEVMKTSIRTIHQVTRNQQMVWLIADPMLGANEEERWKSAVVYLDVLRRHDNLGQLLTVNHSKGSVGFLRYGEYFESQLSSCNGEIELLSNQLSANGAGAFSDRLKKMLESVVTGAADGFSIVPGCQPMHPGLFPDGFFARRDAANRRNVYATAALETETALTATGRGMAEQLSELVMNSVGSGKSFLLQLLRESNVGIGFVENKAVLRERIEGLIVPAREPDLPIISFPSNSKEQKMPELTNYYKKLFKRYLDDMLHYALAVARNDLLKSMAEAVDQLSAEKIAEEKTRIQKRLDALRARISQLTEKSVFCQRVLTGSGEGMKSQFHPILSLPGDQTLRVILTREPEDRNWVESNVFVNFGKECRGFIDANLGGVVALDDATIKGLHAVYFDALDQRLDDLLK